MPRSPFPERTVLILGGGALAIGAGYGLASWAGAIAALGLLPWILATRGAGLPLLLQPTNTSSLDGITGAMLRDAQPD